MSQYQSTEITERFIDFKKSATLVLATISISNPSLWEKGANCNLTIIFM